MSNVKLTYFNGRGLAETIRYLLKYGNIDFEDVRIERDDWPALKPSIAFGQLPVYEENGKATGQSLAIARYLAKKVNLIGNNDWENLEIDAIVDTITDLRIKTAPIYNESDPEKKEALKKTLLEETVPFYLDRFEKFTTQNNGYLAANKLTWVDLCFAACMDVFRVFLGVNVLENYNGLTILKKTVEELPALKAWIASRPETPF